MCVCVLFRYQKRYASWVLNNVKEEINKSSGIVVERIVVNPRLGKWASTINLQQQWRFKLPCALGMFVLASVQLLYVYF